MRSTNSGELAGKKAVVTGAARGIGAATAERFVAEGTAVLLVDTDEPSVSSLAHHLGQQAVRIDLSRSAEIDSLFRFVQGSWGMFDILVNNAGARQP